MVVEKANNPSYGWRSITAAKEVLKHGLQKKIGNGYDTKVWEEPWVPVDPPRPARSKSILRDQDLRVHHLIDQEQQDWNLEMLNEFISPEDIPSIVSLKVSTTDRPDSYCWDFTKSGLYTIKSGYEVAHKLRTAQANPEVIEPSITSLKKATWKTKAPRKLKHFIWQALSGFIATTKRLHERHCTTDSTCIRCGAEAESINHMLFECPPALQVWALSAIPSSPGAFPCNSLYGNIDFLLWRAKEQGASGEVMKVVPWLMWYIWKSRNEKLFNNKNITPLETLQLAEKESESWFLAQVTTSLTEETTEEPPDTTPTETVEQITRKWRCQVDDSWISREEGCGQGFVVLEDNTPIIYGVKGGQAQSPLHAEAEGLIWALQEILKLERNVMHIESDCQQLVNIINREEDWPALAVELDEIKAYATRLLEFSISFIPRVVNVRADGLAKGVRSCALRLPYVNGCAPRWLAIPSYTDAN